MAKQKRSFVNVFSYILIVLLILAICGGIVYFTNGLTTEFKSFYLIVNGEDILDDKGGIAVSANQSLKIEPKYVLGVFNKDLSGYSYEIKANPEANFSFNVGEDSYDFAGDNLDFSKCFSVVETETELTLTAKAGDIEHMLAYIFPDSEITIDGEVDYSKDLFLLTVKSYNEKASITLGLHYISGVSGITLDMTEIVF